MLLVLKGTRSQWPLCWSTRTYNLSMVIRRPLWVCLGLFSVAITDCQGLGYFQWTEIYLTHSSEGWKVPEHDIRVLFVTPACVIQTKKKSVHMCTKEELKSSERGRERARHILLFWAQPFALTMDNLFLKVESPWLSHLLKFLSAPPHGLTEG